MRLGGMLNAVPGRVWVDTEPPWSGRHCASAADADGLLLLLP